MNVNRLLQSCKSAALAMLMVLGMMQCAEEQIVSEQITQDIATESKSVETEVSSISVTGLFTEFSNDITCSTCSYMVSPSEKTVDGKALGLKAGSVICLKKAVKYAAVEFVNLEGTSEKPITIGYCAD